MGQGVGERGLRVGRNCFGETESSTAEALFCQGTANACTAAQFGSFRALKALIAIGCGTSQLGAISANKFLGTP